MVTSELLVLVLDTRPSSHLANAVEHIDIPFMMSSLACAFKTTNRYNGVSLIAYDGKSTAQLVPEPPSDNRSVFAATGGIVANSVRSGCRHAIESALGGKIEEGFTSGIAAAIVRSLGFIKRCQEGSALNARILEIHFCGSPSREFVPLMNASFCAARMGVMVDSLLVRGTAPDSPVIPLLSSESSFNAQVADITGGLHHIFSPPEANAAQAVGATSEQMESVESTDGMALKLGSGPGALTISLLQTVLTLFSPSAAMRPLIAMPKERATDARPSSFDTGKRLSVGLVCTVCLAVFESPSKRCAICGTRFEVGDQLRGAGEPKTTSANPADLGTHDSRLLASKLDAGHEQ